MRIGFDSGLLNLRMFLLKVWLVPFTHEVSKCCSGVFDIWSKMGLELIAKVKKSDQGGIRGEANVVPGGIIQRFRKTYRNTNARLDETSKQMVSK